MQGACNTHGSEEKCSLDGKNGREEITRKT
jgi:hypothetical protein